MGLDQEVKVGSYCVWLNEERTGYQRSLKDLVRPSSSTPQTKSRGGCFLLEKISGWIRNKSERHLLWPVTRGMRTWDDTTVECMNVTRKVKGEPKTTTTTKLPKEHERTLGFSRKFFCKQTKRGLKGPQTSSYHNCNISEDKTILVFVPGVHNRTVWIDQRDTTSVVKSRSIPKKQSEGKGWRHYLH